MFSRWAHSWSFVKLVVFHDWSAVMGCPIDFLQNCISNNVINTCCVALVQEVCSVHLVWPSFFWGPLSWLHFVGPVVFQSCLRRCQPCLTGVHDHCIDPACLDSRNLPDTTRKCAKNVELQKVHERVQDGPKSSTKPYPYPNWGIFNFGTPLLFTGRGASTSGTESVSLYVHKGTTQKEPLTEQEFNSGWKLVTDSTLHLMLNKKIGSVSGWQALSWDPTLDRMLCSECEEEVNPFPTHGQLHSYTHTIYAHYVNLTWSCTIYSVLVLSPNCSHVSSAVCVLHS